MQVSIESSTGLERQLKIGVPADKIEQEVTARLEKATKTVSIKGFRKGKVFAKKLLAKLLIRVSTKRFSRKTCNRLVSHALTT
jgi:FKBP-type peptidyl-prolyl cis-trans isomerase (trigger factor)